MFSFYIRVLSQAESTRIFLKSGNILCARKDWLQGLVEKLKNAYKDLTPGSAIAQQTRSIVTQSEEILNAWVDVATDAVVNYNLQDGQKNNTPDGVQYSARRLSDQIDDIANQTFDVRNHVYYGTTPRALSNILSIPIMPMLGTQTHAYAMALSKQQAQNEGRRTSGLHFHELGWDTVKAIPDMLSHPLAVIKSNTDATDSRFVVVTNATDKEGRPIIAAIAPKGSGKYYNLDMMATVMLSEYGRNGFQNYLAKAKTENRILWIDKKNHHEQASPGVQFSNALLHGDYTSNLAQFKQIVKNEFDGTVFQNTFDEKGDRLFSSRNVQQTKNLVALHNITEDKFLKTLSLGGFPMPSIAITKADIPHTNFGDITVVFGRETIDPKANRKNTVYSADAWTPTVPQVEYEADSKATSRVYKRLSGLRNQVDEYFQRDLGYATYDLEDAMNRYGGEEGVVQAALDNYGVKAAYLEEQGKHIQPVTRQAQVTAAITPEVEDKYLKIMQVLGITSPEEISGMILKDVRNQHGEELEKIWPGVTKTALRLSNTLKKIQGYLLGIGTEAEYKTVTDVAATKEAVDSAIDQAKFEAWVRNLYQGVEKSSGVYNGKPRFTEGGNSRTFKQLHLPATLEGIVKAMAAQNNGNTKNVSGFNGVKTLRAGTAERFSSIADMHKMEGRLQNLTEAQQNEIHDSLSNRLYDTIKAIDEESGANLGESNSLIRYDTIGEVLMEIAESGSYNVADIQRVFQQYGKAISDETAMAAKELLFDISQMPVNIFEAKPERAVGFEEIKNVLVPDTASQKLLQELDSRGIPYQTYQAGNEEQRHQMVQDMEDIRFSQRSAAQFSQREFNSMAKSFADEIERWDSEGRDQGQSFILGSTGEILQGLGAMESDIYMNGDKITTILREHPEITLQEIKQIPQILNDPVLILKSRNVGRTGQNTRMTLFGSVKGTNGQPVMAVFDLRPTENHFVINDMQKVTSAYTKTTDAVRFVQSSYIMYADKKRTTSLLRSIGFQMPIELLQSGFTGSITYRQRSVNLYGEEFSNVIQEDRLFSSRNVRSAAQLERENEKLRRDKEYLKELVKIQRQGNKDVVPTRASVNHMAESLKKETGARGSTEELARLLDDFYRYIGKGNLDTVTMDELVGKAGKKKLSFFRELGYNGENDFGRIPMTLTDFFADHPKVAIAFSGGVDSAYLLYAAKSSGAQARAYYAHSAFQPQFEREDAQRLAMELDVPMVTVPVDVLSDEVVCQNPPDRCYHCKKAIFSALLNAAREDGFDTLLDGTNASDDITDRPGVRALKEYGVLSPLRMCGLSKGEIRQLSRQAGLFTWDKPAYACLATRIPTGEQITGEKLKRTELAEGYLFRLGLKDFRVREFRGGAKLQIAAHDFELVLAHRREIVNTLKQTYPFVLLDLEARDEQ